MSHTEYRNTLRDLFPGLALAPIDLAAEETIDGFSNHWDTLKASDLLIEQYHNAALAVARALTPAAISEFTSCTRVSCAEQFVREFGSRAFRRPLSDAEVALYTEVFQSGPGADDFRLGVQLTVMSMLQSGSFLYRPELGVGEVVDARGKRLDGYETATRLSYFAWSSTPDEELLAAAERGGLDETAGIASEFERLLRDPRARDGITQFFSEWLRFPKLNRVNKKAEDNLDDTLRAELLESAQRLVYDTIFAEGGTSIDLLTTTTFPATRRVAALLGVEGASNGWSLVETDPVQRSGILTHPAFLAAHGYGGYPSPVLRGVYIMDRILCAPPTPPPPTVVITLPGDPTEESESRTNREAYVQATSGDGCIGCHAVINPLGFAFENYDTMGRYRTEDAGFPVDASGSALGFEFGDGIELIHQLAENVAFQRCVVKKVLTYGMGGSPIASDPALQDEVLAALVENDYSLKTLFTSVATHDRFSQWLAVGETP